MTTFQFLLRQRGYTLLSLVTLALAVGANLVVFSVVNALWLRPRPVKNPAGIVMVMGDTGGGDSEQFWFGELGLQRQVRDVPAFSLVAGQVMTSGVNATLKPDIVVDAVGHSVETLGVTSEYFSVLGLAVRGRDFTREDDRPGAPAVAIVSDRLWKSALGGRPEAVGRLFPSSPMPLQIIGIAPEGFEGARLGERADLWIPRNLVPRVSAVPAAPDGTSGIPQGGIGMLALARLRPSVTPAEAQHLIDRHEAGAAAAHMTHLVVVPLADVFGSPDHRTLLINEGPVLRVVSITALLVLAGGCATLMALVLVHYERRRQEFAIRLALGASRPQLVRRLAAELAWLVAAGSASALMVTAWGLRALPALDLPDGIDLGRVSLAVDWRVALVGLAASALTTVVAACLPLARFTGDAIARSLVSSTGTAAVESLRIRKLMLAIHVAATVVVLAAAGLFVRTVARGFGGGAGFDIDHTLFVSVDIGTPYDFGAAQAAERAHGGTPRTTAEWSAQTNRLSAQLMERRRAADLRLTAALRAMPGIDELALGPAPLGVEEAANVAQPKFVESDATHRSTREFGLAGVGSAYLETLKVRMITGRALTDADARQAGESAPAVVTASLADALWPGQNAVGRHLRVGFAAPGVDYDIVGVAADFAFGSMRFDPPAAVFSAIGPDSPADNTLHVVLRTPNPEALADPVRRLIDGVLSRSPTMSISTGRDLVAADLGRERLGAWFFSGFGLVALGLGVGGVFGLVAYLAESRRKEFGVRLALGATPANLLRVALMAGLGPTIVGAGVGLVGSVGLAIVASSFVIGIDRFDAPSFASAAALILTTTLTAGLVAAQRIHRISPMEALRSE